jgi:hypothetical protein
MSNATKLNPAVIAALGGLEYAAATHHLGASHVLPTTATPHQPRNRHSGHY